MNSEIIDLLEILKTQINKLDDISNEITFIFEGLLEDYGKTRGKIKEQNTWVIEAYNQWSTIKDSFKKINLTIENIKNEYPKYMS